jgi:macrolide transport system ATP-binding/permease protein
MIWLTRDLATAWRRLRATPAFSVFSVLTLALGIAGVTVAYSVLRAVAAPPSGVPDVRNLLAISHSRYGPQQVAGFSLPDFEDLRRRQTTMTDVAAFATLQQVLVAGGQTRVSLGEVVTGNYFQLLGVSAVVGRVLQPLDDQPGAVPVTVVSHDVWQRQFSGRADVIGQHVTLGGHPFEVVGVAPADFLGLFGNGRFPALAWVPLSAADRFAQLGFERRQHDRTARWLHVRARPRAGQSLEQIAADVATVGGQLDLESPLGPRPPDVRLPPYHRSRQWVARYSRDLVLDERIPASESGIVAMLLMSTVALVLLVVCSNLANLIVARGVARRHELALRLALGAQRSQLVFGCTAEALILTVGGSVGGLILAWLALLWLGGPFDLTRGIVVALKPELDLGALAVSMGAALATWVAAGVVPAAMLTRRSSHAELMSGAAPAVTPRWRARRVLIAGQVAVSVVLLATAALLLGEVSARTRFTGGLELDRFAVAEVDLLLQNYGEERARHLVDRVLDRMSRHRSVEAAAVSVGLPFGPGAPLVTLTAGAVAVPTQLIATSEAFFATVGIPIIEGQNFEVRRASDRPPEVIIDAGLAQQLFGRTDVVGQHVDLAVRGTPVGVDPGRREIVGVVRSAGLGSGAGVRGQAAYIPLTTGSGYPLVFSVRTQDDPARIADELRSTLVWAEPELGISQAGSARAIALPATGAGLAAASIASLLGGLGQSVVLAGLYGMLSFLAACRTREIGMRLALGATPDRVLRMMVAEGLAPVLAGIIVGGAAALLLREFVSVRLFGLVPQANLLLLACVPLLMVLASATACYVPARRASRVNPADALKQ